MVPQSLLSIIEQKQREQISPLTSNLVRLRGEMDDVLREDVDVANAISSDGKAKAYTQSLQRYLTYKDQQNDTPLAVKVVPSIKSNDVSVANTNFSNLEDEIIHSAPVNLKNRAKLVIPNWQRLVEHHLQIQY